MMPFWNPFSALVILSVLFRIKSFLITVDMQNESLWLLANSYNNLENSLLGCPHQSKRKMRFSLKGMLLHVGTTEWKLVFSVLTSLGESVRSAFIVEELKVSIQCMALFLLLHHRRICLLKIATLLIFE